MRLDYDLDANALYIHLTDDQTATAVTKEVDEETFVDLDANGAVIGIEVIHPQRSWPLREVLSRFLLAHDDEQQLLAYFDNGAQQILAPTISLEESSPLCIA